MRHGTMQHSERFRCLVFESDSAPTFVPEAGSPRTDRAQPTGAVCTAPALGPEESRFYSWLCARSNLRAADYRASVLKRRSPACLRAVRAGSHDEARAAAEACPERADRLLDALLVGVTAFFRDAPVFEALHARLRRRTADGRGLRVLSVGCSNGAEVYSCAMLLAELGVLGRSSLLGLDCRPAAVRAARRGVYPAGALDAVPARLRDAYFVTEGSSARVRDDLALACEWRVGDAFTAAAEEPCDLLLCRNLAIYLNPDAAARMWARLHARLAPGGLLVVGKAERPPAGAFRRVGPCLFEREGGPG